MNMMVAHSMTAVPGNKELLLLLKFTSFSSISCLNGR